MVACRLTSFVLVTLFAEAKAVEDSSIKLGIYAPFTSITHGDLAVAVLLDLDFRKNFDPAVRQRFGPPIIALPSLLHPDLNVSLELGTSHSTKTIGVATTLDWFLGVNGFDKVVGVVGGYFSAIAVGIAANAEVFKVPQVAFGATNDGLSDKAAFPWFLRTIPPDSVQGAAMWSWMNYFDVPAVTVFYRKQEAYGEGLLQITLDKANSAGQPSRVSGIGVELVDDDELDLVSITDGLMRLRTVGRKVVIIVISDPLKITMTLYAMEQEGMLYNEYQILGPDAFSGSFAGTTYFPSRGYPAGVQKFTPVTEGDLYPKFLEMWRMLQPDDVYGEEAISRYKLDRLHVPLNRSTAAALTLDDFSSRAPWFFSNFLFDAGYTFIHAFNNMLNAGVPVSEIKGEKLLQELRNISFEGITGYISFDAKADRIGDFELWNVLQEGGDFESVAFWSGDDSFEFREGADHLTWAGGIVSATAPATLVACAPGQWWDEHAGLCISCPRNLYSQGGEIHAATCTACRAGQISNSPSGATGCLECEPGTFRGLSQDSCETCPAGTFAAGRGQSVCTECAVGEFAPAPGMQACRGCGAGLASQSVFKTMIPVDINGDTEYAYLQGATSPEQCGCDRGYRESDGGECIACGRGVQCGGMGEVQIEAGYYAAAIKDYELSVFRCHGEPLACSGGVPGATCANGREGISCADCKAGMRPSRGGICVDCKPTDWWPLTAVLLGSLVSLVILYHLLDKHQRAAQSHAFLLFACSLGQLVAVTQHLGVVGMLPLLWKPPLDSGLRLLGLLTFDINIVRLNCIAHRGSLERFSLQVFVIFQAVAAMLLIHILYVLFRHGRRFRGRLRVLVSAIYTLFMIFNIAVTSTVLLPLQCQDHPNRLWTVKAYPGVLCWTSDVHKKMLLLGAAAFLAGPATCITACAYVVYSLPQRVRDGDTEFLQACSFLYMRFRPTCHSYALIHILRSFFVAVVLVVPDIVLQILMLNAILLLGFGTIVHLKPWRVPLANLLDCILTGGTLIFTCIIAVFLPEEDEDARATAVVAAVLLVSMLACAPLVILYALYRKLFRSRFQFGYFLCHHKNGSGAFTRLLKMALQDSPRVPGKVFLDADNLDNVDNLFDLVAHDTKNLLVMCTQDIWTRAWCVGEMCVARLHKVLTCALLLAGSVLPHDELIEDFENCICNREVLTESGISSEMIVSTFQWIHDQPCVDVPESTASKAMASLVEDVLHKTSARQSSLTKREGSNPNLANRELQAKCVSFYDVQSREAAATAEILKKCCLPYLSHEADMIPEPCSTSLSEGAVTAVIVLCMNSLFATRPGLYMLAQIGGLCTSGDHTPRLLPLICEQSFSFPPKDIQEQLEAVGIVGDEAEVTNGLVVALFKEIAIHFIAQHMAESQLALAAKDVGARLLANIGKEASSGHTGHSPLAASRQRKTKAMSDYELESHVSDRISRI